MKFLKLLWGISIFLNGLLIVEYAIEYFTGYFFENRNSLIGFVVWLTILTLVITLVRAFSYPERQRRKHLSRGYWHLLSRITFGMLYCCFGLIYWFMNGVSTPGANFSISAVGRTAVYQSPSGQRAVVFKEVSTLADARFIYAYEKRGPFQRSAFLRTDTPESRVAIASEWSQKNDLIRAKFFDETQIDIEWSEDEESLEWILKHRSEITHSGTVEFVR